MPMALLLKKSFPLRRLLRFPSSTSRDFYCPPASGKRTDDELKALFMEWAKEKQIKPTVVLFKAFRRSVRLRDKDNARWPPPLERTEDECKAIFDAWIIDNFKLYPSVLEKKLSLEAFKSTLKEVDESRRTGDPSCGVALGCYADCSGPPISNHSRHPRNYGQSSSYLQLTDDPKDL